MNVIFRLNIFIFSYILYLFQLILIFFNFKNFAKKIQINNNKKPFRIPSGISFVRIDPSSGKISNNQHSISEPFILGSEPYSGNINVIDGLENFNNNSISGTGGLLE